MFTSRFINRVSASGARRKMSQAKDGPMNIVAADDSMFHLKQMHIQTTLLAIITPIAFILPSPLSTPLDLALGVLIPYHAHVGMNGIISDYVPKGARGASRALLLATTAITAAGLLVLNVKGPGFTECLRSLWRKKSKSVHHEEH